MCSLPVSIQSLQRVHHEASKPRSTRHRSENGRKKNKQFEIADDTTLLAESKEELLQLVTSVILIEKSAQAGLYLNLKKTKIMSTEEIEECEVDGETGVVGLRDFIFLGATIEDSGSCKGDILRRLALGRVAMTGLDKIWKDKDITITTKCRIVNALVFPVVLYGCESWTMRKAECYEYHGLQDELTNQLLKKLKLPTR